eukprot:358742-Chlamydomonas_euryale.AAC.3
MKSASGGDHQVACIVPGSVPAALSARRCVQSHRLWQLLKDAIALPDLLLVAAATAAHDGRGHLRRDIGNALDALACGWVDCLDAFRPARPAKFLKFLIEVVTRNLKICAPAAQAIALNDRFWSSRRLNKRV